MSHVSGYRQLIEGDLEKDQASAYLHGIECDSEELKDVGADREEGQHEAERPDASKECLGSPVGLALPRSDSDEYSNGAYGVHDCEKGHQGGQVERCSVRVQRSCLPVSATSGVALVVVWPDPVPMKIQTVVNRLRRSTRALEFADPVTHVYAPLEYASESVGIYLDRYVRKDVEALFLGMNPGPWGMAQTGIPFGEVDHVRRFLRIDCPVGRPDPEHPRRPVEGFQCQRSEVSGRRLWSWVESRFQSADDFFDRFFIWNWCPLAFLEETGRNRTPDKLPAVERQALEEVCDTALRGVVDCINPSRVIGVGAYARKRAEIALKGRSVQIDTILHPSPASPMANRGWAPQVEAQLKAMGVELGGAAADSAK